MSDRIAEQCSRALEALDEIEPETEQQRVDLTTARESIKRVIESDRERNGATPTDKLIAHIDNTDECPNCGDPIDEGGWCSLSCMQADLGKQEADS